MSIPTQRRKTKSGKSKSLLHGESFSLRPCTETSNQWLWRFVELWVAKWEKSQTFSNCLAFSNYKNSNRKNKKFAFQTKLFLPLKFSPSKTWWKKLGWALPRNTICVFSESSKLITFLVLFDLSDILSKNPKTDIQISFCITVVQLRPWCKKPSL